VSGTFRDPASRSAPSSVPAFGEAVFTKERGGGQEGISTLQETFLQDHVSELKSGVSPFLPE
ncbi:hypothetical protein, partial [Paracoccus acridae]|uniref:hypothetical protein n=1 Tax=Paracoccus acridae TaxID=1795310 RepID=UPI001E59A2E7